MAIVSFNINKMVTERKNSVRGKISIKNNVSIKNIEKADLSFGKEKQEGLRYNFEFSCVYEPNIGHITIEGDLLDIQEKKRVDDILTKWKKEKKIEPGSMQNILNTVFGRCNLQALIISRDINLPPPIPIVPAAKGSAPKE